MFALFIKVVFNVVGLFAFFDTQGVSGWWSLLVWVLILEYSGVKLIPLPAFSVHTLRYVALVIGMWFMFKMTNFGSELSWFEVIYWLFGAMWIVTKVYDLYDMLTSKKLKFNLMADFENKLKKGFFL